MAIFLFGVSMGEILLILLVFLMLFGSKKIPEFARSIGKGLNEFKKATDDIKKEFQETTSDISNEIKNIETEVNQNSNEIRNLGDDFLKEYNNG
jgi:TatA/E family protein of Tat protein translocase